MPLTIAQADDSYIKGSMALFLDRNVKPAYDAAATASATASSPQLRYPGLMSILGGKPDDISIVRAAPSIAVSFIASKSADQYEVGTNTMCRYRNFVLSCYPGLDSTGAPCETALNKLRSLMTNAFEAVAIKIVDYGNVSCTPSNILFCKDVMYIHSASGPIERASTLVIAEEKHRFDMHIGVYFAVQSQIAT
jgi:hypothetical protein